jgi:hypothetical protein
MFSNSCDTDGNNDRVGETRVSVSDSRVSSGLAKSDVDTAILSAGLSGVLA